MRVEVVRRIKKYKFPGSNDFKYVETIENAMIIKKNNKSAWVRLHNGDIVKRKLKDVIIRKEDKI